MEPKPLIEVYRPRSAEERHDARTFVPGRGDGPVVAGPAPKPPRAVSVVNPPAPSKKG